MPEAFAVFAVLAVVIAAWIGAALQSRNPVNHRPVEEGVRLEQHAEWLRQRLEVAQRENWDEDMTASLAAELAETLRQLARVAR
jgi:hypothetical protein